MLFSLLILLHFLCCLTEQSYTFDFIIHRNIEGSIESYFKLKFESTTQLCYGPSSTYTNFFIAPNSLYSWIQDESYISRRRRKESGDPHSDDYGQFYLQNEVVSEVYSFNEKISIASLTMFDLTLLFSPVSKDPFINSSIGLLRSITKSKYTSFLEQLYNVKGVNEDAFTIQYINSTAGRITFGALPNKKPEQFLYNFDIHPPNENPQALILIKHLYFNGITINSNFKVNLDESYAFIQCPDTFKHLIEKEYKDFFMTYFQPRYYHTPSTNNYYWQNITFYVCDKSMKETILRQLPEIRFQISGFDVIIRKENMLVEYENNQLIFALVFTVGDLNLLKSVWILGEPFLKEYDIEHNFSTKMIKLYQREFKLQHLYSDNDLRNNPQMLYYFVFLLSLSGFILGLITSFQFKQNKLAILA